MADFVDPIVTAEIVAAKNKLVTEANRAETIVDDWYNTGNLVKDAPADGLTYGRKDNTWVEAGGAGGGGDMSKAQYDPQTIEADAFDRANMTGVQAIDTVSGLTTSLNSKIEEAPNDGQKYVRQNESWQLESSSGTPLTKEVVYDAADAKGSAAIFATEQAMNTADSGYFLVDAIGAGDKGTFPFEGIYRVRVGKAPDTQIFVSGLLTNTAQTILEATLVNKGASEDDSVVGIYTCTAYQVKTDAPTWVKVAALPSATSSVAWGDVTGTLSAQTDLQSALDSKVDVVAGKGLSTEDYSTAEKSKLGGIAPSAQVNKFDFTDAPSDTKQYARKDGVWEEVVSGGGGASTLLELTDTPANYTGSAGKIAAVNAGETAIEFIDAPSGGGSDPWSQLPINIKPTSADAVANGGDFNIPITTLLSPAVNKGRVIDLTRFGTPATPQDFAFPTPEQLGWDVGDSIILIMKPSSWTSAVIGNIYFNKAVGGQGAPLIRYVGTHATWSTGSYMSNSDGNSTYHYSMLKLTATQFGAGGLKWWGIEVL